jgi:hypothetical protein
LTQVKLIPHVGDFFVLKISAILDGMGVDSGAEYKEDVWKDPDYFCVYSGEQHKKLDGDNEIIDKENWRGKLAGDKGVVTYVQVGKNTQPNAPGNLTVEFGNGGVFKGPGYDGNYYFFPAVKASSEEGVWVDPWEAYKIGGKKLIEGKEARVVAHTDRVDPVATYRVGKMLELLPLEDSTKPEVLCTLLQLAGQRVDASNHYQTPIPVLEKVLNYFGQGDQTRGREAIVSLFPEGREVNRLVDRLSRLGIPIDFTHIKPMIGSTDLTLTPVLAEAMKDSKKKGLLAKFARPQADQPSVMKVEFPKGPLAQGFTLRGR